MRCLVTGGTGFVGSNLVIELMKQGHDIVITGNDSEQKIPGFNGKYLQPGMTGVDWKHIGKVDVVFHQAAINDTVNMDSDEMMHGNVEGSMAIFKWAIEQGCKHIVYASSTAGYGDAPAPYKEDGPMNPLNPYGESKKILDEKAMSLAKENPDVTIVGLRYCNIYGPRESHKGKRASMIYQLALQMQKGDPKLFKHGEQKRDWIYVKDVVRANILASKATESCIVNCGVGGAVTFNKLVEILNEVLGVDRKPIYIDNPIADVYQTFTECDMSLAKEKIGFVPKYTPETGIKDFIGTDF